MTINVDFQKIFMPYTGFVRGTGLTRYICNSTCLASSTLSVVVYAFHKKKEKKKYQVSYLFMCKSELNINVAVCYWQCLFMLQ